MDLSSVVDSTVSQLNNTRAGGDTQGLNVLKAALEVDRHTTQQIVESVPEPAAPESKPSSNPPHLGNNVDVHA